MELVVKEVTCVTLHRTRRELRRSKLPNIVCRNHIISYNVYDLYLLLSP